MVRDRTRRQGFWCPVGVLSFKKGNRLNRQRARKVTGGTTRSGARSRPDIGRLICDLRIDNKYCALRRSLLHYLVQLRGGALVTGTIPQVFSRDRVRTNREGGRGEIGHAPTQFGRPDRGRSYLNEL